MIALRSDIPFDREEAHRFLPWVVGLMVCLAGLFLAAALSVHQSTYTAGRLHIHSFQIYVPYENATDEALRGKLENLLEAYDEVESVDAIAREELARLITPWTGSQPVLDDLPLPLVLEVTLNSRIDRGDVVQRIEQAVTQLDATIEVESYQQWVDQLMRFARMLRLLAIVLACLIVAGLAGMVVLMSRTSLKLHFKAVQLLHNIGAQDDYITRQFVINGCWVILRGALPGAGIAAIIYTVLAHLSSELASPLLPNIEVLPIHLAMFILLPILSVGVAYLAVRMSVQHMIEGMH